MSTPRPGRLANRIFAPDTTAPGRRCEQLLQVLRDWGEPITARDLAELLDWGPWAVDQALVLLTAEGRVASTGRRGYIADPPLAPTLAGPRHARCV